MPTAALESSILVFHIHGVLLAHHCGNRLEGDPEENGLAVGNATLNSAGAVAGGENLAIFRAERVIVLTASQEDPTETRADVEAF